ncbi:hypothetical protein C8Q80DRAFT_130564 [Daedaleopsis nitida]|nr:hypothetical protein C8Q80DRAFT_130564 [Daedaleopsis nitida]
MPTAHTDARPTISTTETTLGEPKSTAWENVGRNRTLALIGATFAINWSRRRTFTSSPPKKCAVGPALDLVSLSSASRETKAGRPPRRRHFVTPQDVTDAGLRGRHAAPRSATLEVTASFDGRRREARRKRTVDCPKEQRERVWPGKVVRPDGCDVQRPTSDAATGTRVLFAVDDELTRVRPGVRALARRHQLRCFRHRRYAACLPSPRSRRRLDEAVQGGRPRRPNPRSSSSPPAEDKIRARLREDG